MRVKRFIFLGIFFLITNSCVELYDFKPKEAEQYLVVEGFISNISYRESTEMPQDPRFFTVKLRYTSVVSNVEDAMINDATVSLIDESGSEWFYQLNYVNEEFVYELHLTEFKAIEDVNYKLHIVLNNGEVYESEFSKMPEDYPMGELSYVETQKNLPKYVAGELQLITVNGVDLNIDIKQSDALVNFRWDFFPSYIFVAPNAPETAPYKTCWVNDGNYLKDYQLYRSSGNSIQHNLTFIETSSNERIAHELTIFVRQQVLNNDSYLFWQDIKDQLDTGSLFDAPPYNVRTNIKSIGHEKPAFGYFNVVRESGKRFYLTPADLSYSVSFTVYCDDFPPPFEANVCVNCMAVSNGRPSMEKPNWWR